jgi:hypothetical protein
MTETSKPLLEFPVVKGRLLYQENETEAQWSVVVARNGSISLKFQPIPLTNSTKWLIGPAHPNAILLPALSLSGVTPEGVSMASESVSILSFGTPDDGTGPKMQLSAEALQLRVVYREPPAYAANLRLIYFAVGMTGHGSPSILTEAGELSIRAPSQVEEPNHITGEVILDSGNVGRATETWLTKCDELAEQVLDMISFAEGHFIRWSIRRLESDKELLVLDCNGAKPTGPAHDAVFSHLALQPFLDLAVTRYTKELRDRTGMQVALEWFLHLPRYVELQLLSAASALEHLVAIFYKKHPEPKLVDSVKFKELRKEIDKIWSAIFDKPPTTSCADQNRLKQSIGSANRGSLTDKLLNMLTAYKVPIEGLEEKIKKAIKARNRTVHEGLYRSEVRGEIYEHVMVLRELLKRIFLTLLQYSGTYQSSLDGMAWKDFPPKNSNTTVSGDAVEIP